MKNFYTTDDINSLTKEQIAEICSFGTENNKYFYSDLKQIKFDSGEYSFILSNGEAIYTQDKYTFDSVTEGKMRYDLITRSLEQNAIDTKMKEDYFADVSSFVKEQITSIKTQSDINASMLENLVSTTNSKISQLILGIDSKTDTMLKGYEKTLTNFKVFNTESYEIKMKKVDNIIEAFGALLKED